MTDLHPQEPQPEQTPVPAGAGTTLPPAPAPPKNTNRNVLFIIGALLVCLCCISAGVGIAGLVGEVTTEMPKVENVLDEYLRAVAGQDAEKAYALMSIRAKRYIPMADIEELLEGNNYMVFEGYQSLAVSNFNLSRVSDPDPAMPQGVVAYVDGTITYADGFTGAFTAVLEQEGEAWRLDGINVNVPPDKFSP